MSIFEQSRHYLNNVLPNIILTNLGNINNLFSHFWFVFFIFSIILFVFSLRLFRKKLKIQDTNRSFDTFLQELSLMKQKREIEEKLIESIQLVKAKYIAVYELRGETYILLESNSKDTSDMNAPLRIGKKDLNSFKKSGNYHVKSIINSSQNNLMLLFSHQYINLEEYYGHFDIILSYYEQVSNKFKMESGEAQSNISKNTSVSLMKLQMDKNQFFKFFISLVIKITKAQGAMLFTKDGKVVFEYKTSPDITLQKVFYIRNTPYKLEFYDSKELNLETITQVGSFLDMAGGFLVNIDHESETVKNYLSFLQFTNQAIELENPYYKNHSLIVKTISIELAKSLFLSENEIDTIALGAELHDIGMIGDLLSVINKDTFAQEDMNLMKEHPLIGSIIVEPICHIYPIADIVKYHHERFDGRGYPLGLKESQIPIQAQVVSLGEFYAGVSGDRSYKDGKNHEEVVEVIQSLSGKMFSPILVNAFIDVEKSLKIKIEKIKVKEHK